MRGLDMKIWEGEKHSKETTTKDIRNTEIRWLSELPSILGWSSANLSISSKTTSSRAVVDLQSREARLIEELQKSYPLLKYERLGRFCIG